MFKLIVVYKDMRFRFFTWSIVMILCVLWVPSHSQSLLDKLDLSYVPIIESPKENDLLLALFEKDSLSKQDRFDVVFYLAKMYHGAGSYGLEYQKLLEARQYAEENWVGFHRRMANIYSKRGKLDSAIYHIKIGLRKTLEKDRDTSLHYAHIINDLGVYFYGAHQYDSAEYCFNTSLKIFHEHASTTNFEGSVHDNLGLVALERQNYEEARERFKRNLLIYDETKARPKQLQAVIRLLYCDIMEGKMTGLKPRIRELVENLNGVDRSNYQGLISSVNHLLDACNLMAEKTDDRELMLKVAQKRVELLQLKQQVEAGIQVKPAEMTDRFFRHQNEIQLKAEKLAFEIQKVKLQGQTDAAASRLKTWILLAAVVIFVLFVVFVLVRMKAKRLAHQVKYEALNKKNLAISLENEQLKSQQLEKSLASKTDDLTNAALEISRKQKWMEQIQEKLEAQTDNAEVAAHIRSIVRELKNQMSTETKNELFFSQIEELNQEFYEKLKRIAPGITNNELELCGMIRLKLSSKDIATYRNVAPASVKRARNRLRKKLRLEPDVILEDFLAELS